MLPLNGKVMLIYIFVIMTIAGCSNDNTIKLIDDNQVIYIKDADLQFGVHNEISPLNNFLLFKGLVNDIEEKTLLHTRLTLRKSYTEFNKLLEEKQLDIAYMYLSESNIEEYSKEYDILFSPYYVDPPTTLILVKDSNIQDITHLGNKYFSFTEPNSINSSIVEAAFLDNGLNKETFFNNYFYSFSVDESLSALQSNMVQAISIDSLNLSILQSLDNENEEKLSSDIRIMKQFDSGPRPIILIRQDLDKDIKNAVSEYFRRFPVDQQQKQISDLLKISRFKENIDDRL